MSDRFADDRPISVFKSDAEAIRASLLVHAVENPRVIDVSHNEGRIWRSTGITPYRVDRDESGELLKRGLIDAQGDWTSLAFIADGSYDVVVWDPPHISDSGRENGIAGADNWGKRFGTSVDEVHDMGNNVAHLFKPFLLEAKRILVSGTGIVLAKLSDQTHAYANQWQHAMLREEALSVGMTPCDLGITIAMQRAGFNDPRWKYVRHFRKVHCFWVVIRNGIDACDPPEAPRVRRVATTPMFGEVST